jgi:hypothetical protein
MALRQMGATNLTNEVLTMKAKMNLTLAGAAAALAVAGGAAWSAQDKYTLQLPKADPPIYLNA